MIHLVNALPGGIEIPKEKPEVVEVSRVFRCQACERTFQSIDQAAMHMLRLHCSVGLQCPCCEIVSGDFTGLRIHIEAAHKAERCDGEATSECVWCVCGIQHETFNKRRH